MAAPRSTRDVIESHLEHRRNHGVEGRARQAQLDWSEREGDTRIHDGADTYAMCDGEMVTKRMSYWVDHPSTSA
jgi:hypothetical protein